MARVVRVAVLSAVLHGVSTATGIASVMSTTEEAAEVVTTPAPTSPLVCDQEGNTPLRNTDTNQTYVIAYYGGGDPFVVPDADSTTILWPYAIDKCTALTPTNANAYGIFTCNEDNSMTYQKYEDADCNDDSKLGDPLTFNGTLQAPLAYNCEGQKDSYVTIDFSLGEGCQANAPTYGVVGVCGFAKLPDNYEWDGHSSLYCDASGAKQEFFEYTQDQCSDDDNYCSDWVFENTCNLVFTAGDNDIYGRVVECNSVEKNQVRDDETDGSSTTEYPTVSTRYPTRVASISGSMSPTQSPIVDDADDDGSAMRISVFSGMCVSVLFVLNFL